MAEDPGGIIIIQSIEHILRDTEITFNYNGFPDDHSPVWFEVE